MNLWEKIGIGIAVLAVLGFVAFNYATKDIEGSSAFIGGPITRLEVVSKSTRHGDTLINSGDRVLEDILELSVNSELGKSGTVYIVGINYTVDTNYPAAIEAGYISGESGGSLWERAPLVLSGDRYILPFIFDDPIVIHDGETKQIFLQTDIGSIDEIRLPNNSRYSISIKSAKDIMVSTPDVPHKIIVDNQASGPQFNRYVFGAYPTFLAREDYPSGLTPRAPNTDIAIFIFGVHGNWEENYEVVYSQDLKSFITMGIEYNLQDDGHPTELILRNGSKQIFSTKKVVLSKGSGIEYVTFDFDKSSLVLPANDIIVEADTTTLVSGAGDSLRMFLPAGLDNINWSVNYQGSYDHGNILISENRYAGKLEF